MCRRLFAETLLLSLALSGGCARYEYNIVQPAEFRQHIGSKQWATAPLPPAEYRFITVENRLVAEIYNQQQEPLRLLGDQSFAVDPRGQSHPLGSQSIAPGAYIKMIFPTIPPRYERTGPSIGIGIGGVFGSARHFRDGFGFYDFYGWDEPRYYTLYDPTGDLYWDWEDEGDVRLTLVYATGGEKTITHNFVLHRQKM